MAGLWACRHDTPAGATDSGREPSNRQTPRMDQSMHRFPWRDEEGPMRSHWQTIAPVFTGLGAAVVFLVVAAAGAQATAEAQGSTRDFTIVGSKYAFNPGT